MPRRRQSDDGRPPSRRVPTDSFVYVTGHKTRADGEQEFRTVAYTASAGATQWTANDRYGVDKASR
jgi:hypothetical protein